MNRSPFEPACPRCCRTKSDYKDPDLQPVIPIGQAPKPRPDCPFCCTRVIKI